MNFHFYSKLVLAFLVMLVFATPVLATTYECTTKQALEWKEGELRPFKPFKHLALRFNDHADALEVTQDVESTPYASIPVHLDSSLGPTNDLVATGMAKPTNDIVVFEIRGWKLDENLKFQTADLSFFFYQSSTNSVSTGTCTKSE